MPEKQYRQLALELSLRSCASFDNFHPGENAEALSAVRRFSVGAEASQIYVWGPAGSGKSHLLHALCRRAGQTESTSAYLALDALNDDDFRQLAEFQSVQLLCIDALDARAGSTSWERALFDLLQLRRGAEQRLVLASRAHPKLLAVSLPDLASRLMRGPAFRLTPLDDEAKQAALVAHARGRGIELPAESAEYLLRTCPRDLNFLVDALERLDVATLELKRRITIPLIKAVLEKGGSEP
jgi:DnaA-homolog protein